MLSLHIEPHSSMGLQLSQWGGAMPGAEDYSAILASKRMQACLRLHNRRCPELLALTMGVAPRPILPTRTRRGRLGRVAGFRRRLRTGTALLRPTLQQCLRPHPPSDMATALPAPRLGQARQRRMPPLAQSRRRPMTRCRLQVAALEQRVSRRRPFPSQRTSRSTPPSCGPSPATTPSLLHQTPSSSSRSPCCARSLGGHGRPRCLGGGQGMAACQTSRGIGCP